ncbi:hypothetical protein HD806DRAFT_482576 [Xylariaceae sp. AK1471]|nr:hypothetical protein HD806DRAFT_482576 [Xylariaceae sp. AK1471]
MLLRQFCWWLENLISHLLLVPSPGRKHGSSITDPLGEISILLIGRYCSLYMRCYNEIPICILIFDAPRLQILFYSAYKDETREKIQARSIHASVAIVIFKGIRTTTMQHSTPLTIALLTFC